MEEQKSTMKLKFFLFLAGLALSAGVWIPAHPVSATHLPLATDAPSCNAAPIKGSCYTGDANCYKLAGLNPPNTVDFQGYCDAAQTISCCTIKPTAIVPGTDLHCTNTLKGNCVKKTDTCGSTAVKVGDCSTDIAGVQRICCQTLPSAQITGPMVAPYNLLEKIPGSSNTVGRLNTYLEDIYRFAFWAVGIAVVFMLTIGGFMYLTSAGNTSRLGTAKTIIFDAFLGLILALVAWLFLNLINPDLVDLQLPTTTVATPPVPPTTGGTSSSLAGVLKATPGVSVNPGGSCSTDIGGVVTQVSPTLSLDQSAAGAPVTHCQAKCPASGLCNGQTTLSETMLRALIDTAAIYPFTITSFTGGDHSGGSSHYQGRAVDIVPGVAKSDWPRVQQFLRERGATAPICDIWDAAKQKNVSVNCDSPLADHIHAAW